VSTGSLGSRGGPRWGSVYIQFAAVKCFSTQICCRVRPPSPLLPHPKTLRICANPITQHGRGRWTGARLRYWISFIRLTSAVIHSAVYSRPTGNLQFVDGFIFTALNRLSVYLYVCNIGDLWSYMLDYFEKYLYG